MKILSMTRGSGKTEALIDWLLQGKPAEYYPNWTRGIVCPTHEQVVSVTARVKKAVLQKHNRSAAIRWSYYYPAEKAVWSLGDLASVCRNLHSVPSDELEFEWAFDNFDEWLKRQFPQLPAIVTMCAEADIYADRRKYEITLPSGMVVPPPNRGQEVLSTTMIPPPAKEPPPPPPPPLGRRDRH